jgi:two-component system, OmpR family, response regulator VanR
MVTFRQRTCAAEGTIIGAMSANPLPKSFPDAVLLCVDDDPAMLDVMRDLLENSGYAVFTAADGLQAIELFRRNRIDLVLVDHEMPGMKGPELAVKIKTLSPCTPVILHSGSLEIPDSARSATDAFVSKGHDTCLLVTAVSNLIMKSRFRS